MKRFESFRTAADALRAVTAESRLTDAARAALTDLIQHPGPGTWSRIQHVRAGLHGERLDALWYKVAPLRTRNLKPQEMVRLMARGRTLTGRITERAPSPSMPRDAWDFVASILALYPTAR